MREKPLKPLFSAEASANLPCGFGAARRSGIQPIPSDFHALARSTKTLRKPTCRFANAPVFRGKTKRTSDAGDGT
jgi:hypothetical protein